MVRVVMALLLASAAVGGFVDATAEATVIGDERMEVSLSVEADDAEAIVARIIDATTDDGEVQTVAMARRGDGRWSATVELRRIDAVVVFENVATAEQSSPATLTELGVDAGVFPSADQTPVEIVIDDRAAGRLWLPVALILAFLAAVAVWVSMGMGEDDDPVTPDVAS